MDLLADLDARGLIHDATDRDALSARLAQGPITLYYGCDPTADSLHVGNLIGLLVLRRFLEAGHRPIALAGGATGMIGDPGGRSEERNLLDEDTLRSNVEAIKEQIARVLGEVGGSQQGPPGEWMLVDNYDWTRDLPLLAFLRDVGKHVTVNQMVARESVRARMESEHGISYTEFSYMLLQANDYRWLHEHEGCELQIGGSDQWGNLLSGVDLIRRTAGASVHALCWPLLTAPSGQKLGKTTGARTWLAKERTSPYELYQHFVQVDDDEVRRYLCWFTLLPVPEVDALVAEHQRAPERRVGQRRLAVEATALVHGPEEAAAAEAVARVLFDGHVLDADAATFEAVAAEVPTTKVQAGEHPVVELLTASGLAASKGEARRLLTQRGVRVNGEVAGVDDVVTAEELLHGRYVLLRRGKTDYGLIVVEPG